MGSWKGASSGCRAILELHRAILGSILGFGVGQQIPMGPESEPFPSLKGSRASQVCLLGFGRETPRAFCSDSQLGLGPHI